MIGMNARTGAPLAGDDHLQQSVADILGTPLGTRLGRREYGSLVPELLDQPMNALGRVRLFAAGALALQRQEPRLRATRMMLAAGSTPGAAVLTVTGRRTDAARATAVDLTVPVRALSALPA
ncbi:GPW/gp25 family protein [Sphingomonas hylomeconis]|uniref:GPW/gp25 family protein n=1 Tax=Sphingomonas hylomeconis TaxID=1395958 RepID=A0ABV7SVY2_9SPHN|nr:GPW/gp25 family protein [Sphingomonas hylomeconis]